MTKMKTNETIRSKAVVTMLPQNTNLRIYEQLKGIVPYVKGRSENGSIQNLHVYDNRYLSILLYNGEYGCIDDLFVKGDKWVTVSFFDENVKMKKRYVPALGHEVVDVDGEPWVGEGRVGNYQCLDGWTIYDNVFPYSLFEGKKKGDVVTLWVPIIKVTNDVDGDGEKKMDGLNVHFCDHLNTLVLNVHNEYRLAMVKISIILGVDIDDRPYAKSVQKEILSKSERVAEWIDELSADVTRDNIVEAGIKKIDALKEEISHLLKGDGEKMEQSEMLEKMNRIKNEICEVNKSIRPYLNNN